MANHFLVTIIAIVFFTFSVVGQAEDNTLFLAVYDQRFSFTYIAWLSANPNHYINSTLPYNISYITLDHHWTSLFVDYHRGNATFHDRENHWIYLSDDVRDHLGFAIPITGGTSGKVDALAIDWLAENVYWVDEGYNWIKMTSYTGGGETVIIDTGLQRPTGIACYPSKGYLFWTELGTDDQTYHPKIERSSMSGSNRITIISKGLTAPKSIAVDTTTNRIYWTDSSDTVSKIESCDLNGEDRRTEAEQSAFGSFESISVDENYIFVSVFGSSTKDHLRYYSKSPSSLVFDYTFETGVQLLDLCVAGPNIQPMPTTLPCDNNECDHFCVSAAGESHECVCFDKYDSLPNGTCNVDKSILHPPFCLIGSDTSAISVFSPTLLHYDLEDKHEYTHDVFGVSVKSITALVVDVNSNLMFFADHLPKAIYSVRMRDGQYPFRIHGYTGLINGLAVDWISVIIYWIDYKNQNIAFSSYTGRNTQVLFHDVIKPSAIAVDPIERYIFWTEETSPPKLVRCDLDGNNRRDLRNIPTYLGSPSGIVLDRNFESIYIVSEYSTFIYFIDYAGNKLEILGRSQYPANDVTIYQDFLLLAESNGTGHGIVEAVSKISGEHEGRLILNRKVTAIGIADEYLQPIPTVPAPTITSMPTITENQKQKDNNIGIIVGGVSGAVVLIILIVIITVVLIICQIRPKPGGTTRDQSVSPELQQSEPPTYESSINISGANQAIGGSAYTPTKNEIAFGVPDNVVLYSKSELAEIDKSVEFNNPRYMMHGVMEPPPRYTPAEDTYVEIADVRSTQPNL